MSKTIPNYSIHKQKILEYVNEERNRRQEYENLGSVGLVMDCINIKKELENPSIKKDVFNFIIHFCAPLLDLYVLFRSWK